MRSERQEIELGNGVLHPLVVFWDVASLPQTNTHSGGVQVGATQSAGLANLEDTSAPQFSGAQPAIRTYVLSGDVTSAQEADSKINKRRQVN